MDELLPIGTIIKTKDRDIVLFMLIGYYPQIQENEKIFDYLAVLYPYGIDNDESFYTINSEQITEVVYAGYTDEESEELRRYLPIIIGAEYEAAD